MGDEKMKKTLLYLLSAVILGILITIVPLITIAQIESGNKNPNQSYEQSLGQGLKQLDKGNGSNNSNADNSDVVILAISFTIALIAYGLVEHKGPRRVYWRLGVPPY
jgi:hypothetical protein